MYLSHNLEQDPPFELPNLCLCLVLYFFTLCLISNTGELGAQILSLPYAKSSLLLLL